jgi:hypothetical protein
MKITLEFDKLYLNCIKENILPRYHGNGFVQLDFEPNTRLNVWPEQRLQCQKVNTQIHNHRFSFRSRVIAGNGKLVNKIYAPFFTDKGDMDLYNPQHTVGRNTVLVKKDNSRCFMVLQSENRIWNEYFFEAGAYHESLSEGLVMTLMTKVEVTNKEVYIACPYDKQPDNEFDRHNSVSVGECWDIIKEGFKKINPYWLNPYATYRSAL